jgi:type II secretory pathway component HofQ
MQPPIPFQTIRRRLFPLGYCLVLLLGLLPAATAAEGDLVERLKAHDSSLRGDNLPVPLLLQAIARQAGVNIFVADTIQDTITIQVGNLTLHDVFHLVMEAKGLHYSERNKVIFVEKAADYRQTPRDLVTVRLCTQYGNAADYLDHLKPLLSGHGRITVANRGNCLIVQEREETIGRIEQMLAELDQPIPQVHIEARIVAISQEAKRRLGIKWGYSNNRTDNSVIAAADLSVAGPSSLAVGFIRDNLNLGIELQALQEENMLRILSAPRVLVLDGKQAEIKQGKEVPFVTQTDTIINTSFREANLSLKVIPKILRDDFIALDVVVTNDSVSLSTNPGSGPLINTQEITTSLLLEDNVTVVIGGIFSESSDNQQGSVPGLSRIPLFGNLFKNSEKQAERSELLVFITPTTMTMRAPVREGDERYRRKVLSHGPLLSNGSPSTPPASGGLPPEGTPAPAP